MPENIPNSDQNVLTTVGLTLAEILNKYRIEKPDFKFVYDDKLSYETAVTKYRADNNLSETEEIAFPLFAFRRSILRPSEVGVGRRMTGQLVKQQIPNTTNARIMRSIHAQFDLEFLFITPSILEFEKFEVSYLADEGITGDKQVEVDMPSEYNCKLPYFINYGVLTEKEFNTEGNYYKFLSGTAVVTGFYLILRGNQALITEINAKIKDLMGPSVIYSNIQIVPE